MPNDITPDLLHDIFEYRDGALYWKFGKRIGKEAGTVNGNGYKICKIRKRIYLVHRLVFLMHHRFLAGCIDHVNCDRSDNKIENLREATHSQNQCNQRQRTSTKSGLRDVYFSHHVNMWRVRVAFDGKRKDFGHYRNINDAKEAAIKARNEMHKEFACHE